MKSPQKLTRILVALVVLSAGFLDYWEYSRTYYLDPNMYMDVVRGTATAPSQYRIVPLRIANFLHQHGHIGLRHAITIQDIFCAMLACYLLLVLLERSAAYRAATNTVRWFASGAFLFLITFYLSWILWYQRPETLPTAALVALMLGVLSWKPPFSKLASYCIIILSTLALAAIQSFVRADVAFCFYAGVFFLCFTQASKELFLPRMGQALLSGAAVLLTGGLQFYIMHVLYPHANYGGSPVFQFRQNITQPLRIFPFLLFLAPWGWTVAQVLRRKSSVESAGYALLAGSTAFLALWCVIGKIDEVRIFFPFALALAPLTCSLAMQQASEA